MVVVRLRDYQLDRGEICSKIRDNEWLELSELDIPQLAPHGTPIPILLLPSFLALWLLSSPLPLCLPLSFLPVAIASPILPLMCADPTQLLPTELIDDIFSNFYQKDIKGTYVPPSVSQLFANVAEVNFLSFFSFYTSSLTISLINQVNKGFRDASMRSKTILAAMLSERKKELDNVKNEGRERTEG